MRYTEIITEANYRNHFDTATTYKTDAEFKQHVASKFGALQGVTPKESKPQAGGAVYIIDPNKGIVGYKKPNPDSPSGFVWFSVKEPFMPATKGAKSSPAPAPVKTAELTDYKILPNREHVTGLLDVPMAKLHLPDDAKRLTIKKYLQELPGLISFGFAGPENGILTIWSNRLTAQQMIDVLEKKPGAGIATSPKAKATSVPPAVDVPATDSEMEAAAADFLRTLQNSSSSYRGHMTHPPQKMSWGPWQAEIRDWGTWQVPHGVYGEDAADYDWEELSTKSREQLKAIMIDVNKRHPKVKLSYSTEEKNWISLNAESKVK